MENLKRTVIKEEYVELTGNVYDAVILSLIVDLSKKTSEGWVTIPAKDLADFSLLNLSVSSMRTHLKTLVSYGYLSEKSSPKEKWGKYKYWKPNLDKIFGDFKKLGYSF